MPESTRLQLANLKIAIEADPKVVVGPGPSDLADEPGPSARAAEWHREIQAAAMRKLFGGDHNPAGTRISDFTVLKRALDARSKPQLFVVYTVAFTLTAQAGMAEALVGIVPGLGPAAKDEPGPRPAPGRAAMGHRPLVVGAGPAGLFCALALARSGYRPVVVERGDDVLRRTAAVNRFWRTGELDPESNVQFGEGGAGTFSDGKLTTRINDPRISSVLRDLVEAGAPEEILYEAKPHVGTDLLVGIVAHLRAELIRLGGEVRFRTRLDGLIFENAGRTDSIGRAEGPGGAETLGGAEGRTKALVGATLSGPEGSYEVALDTLVLAPGNSSRDTFAMLAAVGLDLAAKPFSVGVRIEHAQELIDRAQYGAAAGRRGPGLGAADYQLSVRDEVHDRAAYTFCMCPGGSVIAAASEPGCLVTNGMSGSRRDSGVANAALVVSVHPDALEGVGPLKGVEFQRNLERRAFEAGGGGYRAPVQTVGDFLRSSKGLSAAAGCCGASPTYLPGVCEAELRLVLPPDICQYMEAALLTFDRRLKGFASPAAWLTGVETRTSCPVRITRDATLQAVGVRGLYPAGEGAGYAGGITSAAVDGLRVAEGIMLRLAPPM